MRFPMVSLAWDQKGQWEQRQQAHSMPGLLRSTLLSCWQASRTRILPCFGSISSEAFQFGALHVGSTRGEHVQTLNACIQGSSALISAVPHVGGLLPPIHNS